MGRLDGKVALISGGAKGMGEMHSRAFVAEGARVVLGDILDDRGKAVADELGDAAVYVHLDVTRREDWDAAVAAAEASFGSLNVLVNNAGIMIPAGLEATSEADFMRQFSINQLGPFHGMQAAVAAMKRAGGGSVINISSESGMVGKGGLFARDLGRHNIRVNSVHPGGVLTDFVLSEATTDIDPATIFGRQPIPRIGRRREISPFVVYLASDESSYATASEFVIDGGMISGNDLN
jgi:3alpha(or 20beta)-hydroxysteroid dehydrogenase